MEDEREKLGKENEEKKPKREENLKREEKPKREEDNWFKHYIELYVMVKITNNSYMEIKSHYDDVLNKDRDSLPKLRSSIREIAKKTPLFDTISFGKEFSLILKKVWQSFKDESS